jgi:predicted RNase H-like HicB family nuclease
MRLYALLISAPEGGYVSFNPETGTTSQRETVEEALANLKEAAERRAEAAERRAHGGRACPMCSHLTLDIGVRLRADCPSERMPEGI